MRSRWSVGGRLVAVVVVASVGAVAGPPSSGLAQTPSPAPPAVPADPAAPAADPTGQGSPTSVVPPIDPVPGSETSVPTSLPLEGEAGNASGGVGQAPFDPASRMTLLGALAQARSRARQIEQRVLDELEVQAPLLASREELLDGDDRLSRSERDNAATTASVRESLRRQVVASFVRSDRSQVLLGALSNAETVSRGQVFLDALSAQRADTLDELLRRSVGLSTLGTQLAGDLQPIEQALTESSLRLEVLEAAQAAANAEVQAYAAGSHVYVPGFRLPVVGPVHFIDSWGFPRMAGTPRAHWHEGTDLMAPVGRELVAVEAGTIDRVGNDSGLGGERLWLIGASGTSYYYAHLSGYGPGIAEGAEVIAGQVVGYVGATGNASGGSPHLHFEVHPGGGPAVNPYPLLITAWGSAPMPSEADALAGPGAVLAPGEQFSSVPNAALGAAGS